MTFSEWLSRSSLKSRVTLVVLGGILVAFWSLAFYTGSSQREEMKRFLSRQQQAMANLVAARVEDEIRDRIEVLEQVVHEIDLGPGLSNAKAIQHVIERHVNPGGMFSEGLFVARVEAGATSPVVSLSTAVRIDPSDIQLLGESIRARQPLVGRVSMDDRTGRYFFSIAMPVKDPRGYPIGALGGKVALGAPGMIDEVLENVAATEATYLVVSPEMRTVIASSDPGRNGESLPAPGRVPLIDSFVDGYEGSGVLVNLQGEQELVSVKRVPSAGWYVASVVSAHDAFAPVNAAQRRVMIETSLISLVLAGLLWWLLRDQLRPLSETARTLAEMSETERPMCLLPSARQDEIGSLIRSFNQLMSVLGKRESELRESESRYRMLFEEMSDAFVLHAVVTDADGKPTDFVLLSVNPVFDRLTGAVGSRLIGRRITEVFPDHQPWLEAMIRVAEQGVPESFEFRSPSSGSTVEVRVFRPAPGQVACLFSDVSARKQAEEALRRNLESFQNFFARNSSVMLLIDPASGRIVEANQAAIAYYGYAREALIGKPVSEINDTSSDRLDAESIDALREERDAFHLVHRLANGELRDVEVHLSPIEREGRTMLFSLVHDVTERRRAEARLILMAQTDMLTGLPNRRHFLEMAEHEMARRHRYRTALSVLMMDIDHFKKINDSYGHHVGDLVLQTVGQCLTPMLRNSDVVGRLGGEEFAAMLPETGAEEALEVAERLRRYIEAVDIPCEGGMRLNLTLSIGVASVDGDDERSLDALLGEADAALYAAKRGGRNCVRGGVTGWAA